MIEQQQHEIVTQASQPQEQQQLMDVVAAASATAAINDDNGESLSQRSHGISSDGNGGGGGVSSLLVRPHAGGAGAVTTAAAARCGAARYAPYPPHGVRRGGECSQRQHQEQQPPNNNNSSHRGCREKNSKEVRREGAAASVQLLKAQRQLEEYGMSTLHENQPMNQEEALQMYENYIITGVAGDVELVHKLTEPRLVCVQAGRPGCSRWFAWHAESGLWRSDSTIIRLVLRVLLVKVYGQAADLLGDNLIPQGMFRRRQDQLLGGTGYLDNLVGEASHIFLDKGFEARVDANPWLIAMNGCRVVNLRDGTVQPLQPAHCCSRACRANWDGLASWADDTAASRWPVWFRFLCDLIPDAGARDWFQRALGQALVGSCTERVFLNIVGETGSNGKSRFQRALTYALGSYAGTVSLDVIARKNSGTPGAPTPHLARLCGLRLAFCSEAGRRMHLNEEQVKLLTGGDGFVFRPPYAQQEREVFPTHTIVLFTNHKLRADARDPALWARLCVLPFLTQFCTNPDPADPNQRLSEPPHLVDAKLESEADGVLAWLVAGCVAWQTRPLSVDVPEIVTGATSRYRQEMSPVRVFISAQTCYHAEGRLTAEQIHGHFVAWVRRQQLASTPLIESLLTSVGTFRHHFGRLVPVEWRGRENTGRFYRVCFTTTTTTASSPPDSVVIPTSVD